MRVALVTENFLPKLDGVTRTLAMLLEYLQRNGHQAVVIGPEGSPRWYAGARIFGAHGIPLPFYPELRVSLPEPVLEGRLSRFHPDVIHVVEPVILGAAGITWGGRLGVPVVSSYHTNLSAYCSYFRLGMLVEPTWLYRRYLHNQCERTLCPSPSTRVELINRGFTQVQVWPRGVDTELFSPERRSLSWRRRMCGNQERQSIVLYVGRLSHEKNLMALVSAYSAIETASTQLVVVGDGPARADLERALAGHNAVCTGYLSGEALAEAYASADIFAFPSMTETFGQVVLEAMASHLPVVAFDAEGVRDQVRNGQSGFLVAPGDLQGFAQALSMLVAAPELRQCIGAEAYARATKQSWDTAMDGLLEVYQSVAQRSLSQRAA
ncbi:MAG: glycosyltransferase family 4 protein [Ktedonobacterales bacterium]